jgi:hypothetical protein
LGEAIMLAFRLVDNIQGESLHLSIQPKVGQGVNLVVNRDINASLDVLLKSAAEKGCCRLDGGVSRPSAARGSLIRELSPYLHSLLREPS